MNKIVVSLNSKNVYVKSQSIIIAILFFLALCIITWWSLVPVVILIMYSLLKPNITLIRVQENSKEKIKATKAAWKQYRKVNQIPWKAQWDFYQISSLISNKVKDANLQKSITVDKTAPKTAIQSHEDKPISFVKEKEIKNQEKKNTELKSTVQPVSEVNPAKKKAKFRKIEPIPEISGDLEKPEELIFNLDDEEDIKESKYLKINEDKINLQNEVGVVSEQKQDSKSLSEWSNSYTFKVAGVSYYDLKKAVSYSRENQLFIPYDDYTAKDIKEEIIDEQNPIYETDLRYCIDNIFLEDDPNNKYDSEAIKVNIEINEVKFLIGFVPSDSIKRVKGLIRSLNAGWIDAKITGHLTGGRYKFCDFDDHVKIRSKNYGFLVKFSYRNR